MRQPKERRPTEKADLSKSFVACLSPDEKEITKHIEVSNSN